MTSILQLPNSLLILISHLLFSGSVFVLASPQNITIDDSAPELQYYPQDAWPLGSSCTGCLAKPDSSKTYNETWRQHTYNITRQDQPGWIDVPFNGTSVYVYFTLYDGTKNPTNATFFIDGNAAGSFVQQSRVDPSLNSSYEYNILVYSTSSLSNGGHNLRILNGGGHQTSTLLFDYIQYRSDSEAQQAIPTQPAEKDQFSAPSISTKPLSSGDIAGIVLGSLAGPAIIISLAVWYTRRIRLKRRVLRASELYFSSQRRWAKSESQLGSAQPTTHSYFDPDAPRGWEGIGSKVEEPRNGSPRQGSSLSTKWHSFQDLISGVRLPKSRHGGPSNQFYSQHSTLVATPINTNIPTKEQAGEELQSPASTLQYVNSPLSDSRSDRFPFSLPNLSLLESPSASSEKLATPSSLLSPVLPNQLSPIAEEKALPPRPLPSPQPRKQPGRKVRPLPPLPLATSVMGLQSFHT